jgi:uncharacterized membrane protein YfcA
MHAIFQDLILGGSAVLGGVVNAVAGGGTLLTFPALIWAGQVERVANATSTVALWPGALSSFWAYRTELGSSRKQIALLAVPSFVGGVLGALLLLNTGNETFATVVPYLLLLATLLFVADEPLARWRRRPPQAATAWRRTRWAVVLVVQLLVGIYGGYFGAGIGILMLAAFGLLGLTDIHHMNALKNLNAMCINGIAAAIFIVNGMVDWRLALGMAAGAILGGYAGARVARRVGQKNVRRVIIGIGCALTLWLLLRNLTGVSI